MPKILVVEDEEIIALDIQRALINLGHDIASVVSTGEAALDAVEESRPDLILMDILLAGKMDGIETADLIGNRYDIPVIYLTGHSDEALVSRATITGPFGYLLKPCEDDELRTAIAMALYRHRMERQLRESEGWFSSTLRSIGEGVITTDIEGRVRLLNPVAEDLTGWNTAEASERSLAEIMTIVDPATGETAGNPVRDVMRVGRILRWENHLMKGRKDRQVPAEISAGPIRDDHGTIIGTVLVCKDLTQQKRAEMELNRSRAHIIQQEKLASLGVMLAGIAHEINNPTQAIRFSMEGLRENVGYLKTVLAELNVCLAAENKEHSLGADRMRRLMEEVDIDLVMEGISDIAERNLASVSRITDIIMSTKRMVYKTQHFTECDVNSIIRDAATLTRSQVRRDITVKLDLNPEVPACRGLSHELGQVFMNLIINARDAVREKGLSGSAGELAVSTGYDNGSGYIEVRFEDNGVGMSEEVLSRIFDPFFTTKGVGDGIGLGLYISHRIIQSHSGNIVFESEPGKGTKAIVQVPAA